MRTSAIVTLTVGLGSTLLASPTWAGWRSQYVDPPDSSVVINTFTDGYTSSLSSEGLVLAATAVVGGFLFSTTGETESQETTILKHIWDPIEGECSSARFSWSGTVEVRGTFRINPPGTANGNVYALSRCAGFGRAYLSMSGGSDMGPVSGPSGGVTVTTPLGGGSVSQPSSGAGGGRGFSERMDHDGDSHCVTEALVEKTEFAHAVVWADTVGFLFPRVGSARASVLGMALAEQNKLDECCD